MRAVVSVVVLVALAASGCISQPDGLAGGGATEPALSALPALPVVRFDASGATLDLPAVPATPYYNVTGFRGAEPNMGITSSGAVFATAFSQLIRSTDKGDTWELAHEHTIGGNSDPMMWVDPWTDHVYNAPMYPTLLCALIYHSEDDGATWDTMPFPNCGRGVYDHQKLASGPPGPDAPPAAGLLHDSVLYMCYNALATSNCAVSYDNGQTWPHDAPVTSLAIDGCSSGQVGHPTVSHQGIVAVGRSWGCRTAPVVIYSTDSGLTWTPKPAPSGTGGETLDPEIAFTPDGTLYLLYQGTDHRTYLARLTDLAGKWDGPWLVSPANVTSTAFAALGAGDDGRIAMTFLGTEDTDESPTTAPDETRWHLWMVVSDDADAVVPTFTAYRATPDEDPVQIGCVWLGGGGAPCRNMLDFIDGGVHPDGTWFTAYTEGCHDDCAFDQNATADDSHRAEVAMARLDGFSLYEAAPAAARPRDA